MAAEVRTTFAAGRDFWARVRTGELIEAIPTEVIVREHGVGERHALSLAIEHPDWLLLIDDVRPFHEAQRRGLQTLCTPMLTVMLCGEGVITDERAFIVLARLVAMRTVNLELLLPALAQLREMVDSA